MKTIVTITALLALSSITLIAAGEDWTVKYQRLGHRAVPKASGAPPAFAAPSTTRGPASSFSADMLKASGAPPAFAAPSTHGAASSFSDSAAPSHSSDKAKRDASGNRSNFSRASELNPPK